MAGFAATLLGGIALIGWYLDIPLLRSLGMQFSPLSPNASASFVLAGIAYWATVNSRAPLARGLGGIISSIALLTLIENLFGVNLSIDTLLIPVNHPAYLHPDRMSVVTALNMLLLGTVLVRGLGRASRVNATCMLLILASSWVGLLGLVYNVTSLYSLPIFQSFSILSAFTFMVLVVGYFYSQPSPFLTVLRSKTSAGLTGRRLLPLAMIAPLTFGWLMSELTRNGVVDTAMGVAVIVMLTSGLFVLVINVTMRIQYDEELLRQAAAHDALEFALHRERNRLLNEFVTNTLHDLRTPLSSIGTSAYIAGRIEDAAKRGERLEHIQTEVRQIGKLLDQFAEMVRLNQMEGVVLTPLALNPIVVRAAAEYQVLAERKGVRVVTEVFPGELVAPVSDLLLQTALIQVLNNAVRYTPSGGLITLRTHCRETHALIEIADTGEGIPAAALQRVFDVQYKGNTARTADGSTGGIGLSMVKRILELHHGRVDITSIVGQGTTVSLIIPIHTPPS
ncbi:MAG: HAMP domain-containing histidine kinase [Chloroflexi bacterium]|uniref:sensor histidine kinase n=1 Tax=Candidatus Flexifilum breve TaxID=3140694 RepID=UPI00313567E2|nr:HAMP domain-containing histidine kinase [Chloroflexota bacterium]